MNAVVTNIVSLEKELELRDRVHPNRETAAPEQFVLRPNPIQRSIKAVAARFQRRPAAPVSQHPMPATSPRQAADCSGAQCR